MKVFVMCALFLLSSVLVSADPEAKSIAKKYVYGVTKVLLYDSNIAKEFDLGDDGGYLTRGSGFFVSEDGYLFTNRHVVGWCVGYCVDVLVFEDATFKWLTLAGVSAGSSNCRNPSLKSLSVFLKFSVERGASVAVGETSLKTSRPCRQACK
jgi:hypothetical protein